jgi:hypothetical protein
MPRVCSTIPHLAVVVQDGLLHHAAAQHLQPLAAKEDLHLEAGVREGEVCVHCGGIHSNPSVAGAALKHFSLNAVVGPVNAVVGPFLDAPSVLSHHT